MERTRAMETLSAYTADQWGLVTSAQAKAAGVDGVTLVRLVEANLLDRVRHGCYLATSATPPPHLQPKAAWLLLNPSAPAWERPRLDPDGGVLSHSSAALIHDIGDLLANTVEITVPRRRTTREPDVRLRPAALTEDDVVILDGLPVTTAERTIVDHLRDHRDGGHVGHMIYEAVQADLVDINSLASRIGAYNRRYGVKGRAGGALVEYLLRQGGHSIDELTAPRVVPTYSLGRKHHPGLQYPLPVSEDTLARLMALSATAGKEQALLPEAVQSAARRITNFLHENQEVMRRSFEAVQPTLEFIRANQSFLAQAAEIAAAAKRTPWIVEQNQSAQRALEAAAHAGGIAERQSRDNHDEKDEPG